MSQTSFSSLLQEALAAHQQGSPTRAIPAYERALAKTPDDAEALSLYGLALVQAGRPSEAEKPLRRAVEKEPNRPAFRANLAELLFRVGENEAAIAELKEATSGASTYAPAFVRLGRALVEREDINGAVDAFDRALQLKPDDRQTALMLTRALGATGNYGAAYHVLDHMEKNWPDDLEALKLRLEIARTRRDFSAMMTLATRLTKLAPEDPAGWRDLAATLFESGLFSDALLAFEKALSISGRDAESLAQLATISIQALDFAKAEAALAEAEALDPANARVLSTKALLLTYQGRKKEAEDYCERCFKADPEFAGIYPQLSLLRNGRLTEAEENTIRAYSRRDDIAPAGRATASFVVAHSLEARGETDAAFEEYVRANAEAAERNRVDLVSYDFPGHDAWTDAIINVFKSAEEGAVETYHQGPQPIFVVGLPRCGSTLVESVIAAHSTVQPGGELPMMPNIFNRWFRDNYRAGEANIPPAERERLAAAYMAGLPAPITKQCFTDKNLLNLEAAGMIAQIFPKAVIINVRRNPVENCVSIWRQDMMKYWAFATSFDDLAKRYSLYARLAGHFERTLKGRFHTIQYEDFVTDFADRSRKLIDICGLQWEDACSDFQRARDIAPTISAMQVREDVSLKGDRADRYGARLDPLRRNLEGLGVDLKTGALRQ
jgi:tetratricopeptide (TPR) repeat protein